MPPLTGSYSKGLDGAFDETERLQIGLVRPGIAWVDADENKKEFIRFTWIRRALDTLVGNASPNDGFKCLGDGTANDFLIKGGDGTLNGAGRLWISGIHCFLESDIRYINAGANSRELCILPTISAISGAGNTVLEDSAASYVTSSLVGRIVTPDVTQGATFTITANTATSITVSGDLTAGGIAAGARYRVEMRTPSGADRNDGVYINVSLDEVDGVDLPSITHTLGAQVAAQYFGQVRCVIEVHESDTVGLPGDLSTGYTDLDSFDHFRIKIADINRIDGQATIGALDITDLRVTSANFSTYMKKTGDTMTGDLIMSGADIVLAGGELVDGRDVSADGAILDTVIFTTQGIADLLPKISWPVQGTDLAAVTTQTLPVGFSLRARTPGGTESVKGVITVAPNNLVRIQNSTTLDDFTAGTNQAQKVFGRLTESHPTPVLSGVWTFVNTSFVATGVGGAADTELADGDLLIGPDGLFYTVNGTPPGANTINIVEPFAGVTGPVSTPAARRFILALVMNDGGSELPVTPGTTPGMPASVNIRWHFQEVFDAGDRPVLNPFFGVPEDQVAALVPDASESLKGKSQFAADGSTSALEAVQGSDSRLLGTQARRNSASFTTRRSKTNYIEGSGIAITVTDDAGDEEIEVTISANLGLNTLASRLSALAFELTASPDSVNIPTGWNPAVAIFMFQGGDNGVNAGGGIATGTASNSQHYVTSRESAGTLTALFGTGFVYNSSGEQLEVTEFSATQVTIESTAGTSTVGGVALVIGDIP